MEQQSKDNHVSPNSRQDTYPKGQNQDDKGKQQFKDNQHSQTGHQPNTQNQNNDQDSSDKSNTHLIKLKTHLQKEHNLNNHSL